MLVKPVIGLISCGNADVCTTSSDTCSVSTGILGWIELWSVPPTGLKGLIKSAYYDPNPVVLLEHKGLYWSKIPGTEGAMSIEPDEDYIIPFGKARVVQKADQGAIDSGDSCVIITYGRGVYWAIEATDNVRGQVEIIDLRTLNPLDYVRINEAAKEHGKVMLVTEESVEASFTLGVAGRIQRDNFEYLEKAKN